jgi:hypothetical protein
VARAASRSRVSFAVSSGFGRARDARVQHLRQPDVEREDIGPLLAADSNGVLESRGDDEQRRLAAPLEQRVRRDRRAHLHGRDVAVVGRRGGEQPLDGGDGSVVVTAGSDGQ